MEHGHKLILIIGLSSLSVLTTFLLTLHCCRRRKAGNVSRDIEAAFECNEGDGLVKTEDLIKFEGGEDLSVQEILDAPGEVIGKSSYGTLYKASLFSSNSLTLLRFLRPTCTLRMKEVMPIVELLGSLRHPNLAPLNAFYAGPRGEKLMVHPFYGPGNLAQFIRGKALMVEVLLYRESFVYMIFLVIVQENLGINGRIIFEAVVGSDWILLDSEISMFDICTL